MKFVVSKNINARWYWTLRSDDGAVIAESKLSFAERAHAVRNVQEIRAGAPRSLIFDPLGNPLGEGLSSR
jgi:uncharacterized protein YegP (UPF0339 family)